MKDLQKILLVKYDYRSALANAKNICNSRLFLSDHQSNSNTAAFSSKSLKERKL